MAPDIPVFDTVKHHAELTRDVETELNDLCQRVKLLRRYPADIRAAMFRVVGASAQVGYREASNEAAMNRAMLLEKGDFRVID